MESQRRSALIDNFYGKLENMRFVIVNYGSIDGTGAEHAKRREFVIIGRRV